MLTAIAIPVFTSQLEKSREATDQANLRSAYAEVMTNLLTWDGNSDIPAVEVTSKQTKAKWQSAADADSITIAGGLTNSLGNSGISVGTKINGAKWTVDADTTNMKVTIS